MPNVEAAVADLVLEQVIKKSGRGLHVRAMTRDRVQKRSDSAQIAQRSRDPEGGMPEAFDIVKDPEVDQIAPHKVMPARGIVIGVVASAVIWAIIALLFF